MHIEAGDPTGLSVLTFYQLRQDRITLARTILFRSKKLYVGLILKNKATKFVEEKAAHLQNRTRGYVHVMPRFHKWNKFPVHF